jgi:hypothetical protein
VDDVAQGIIRRELGLREYHYVTNGYFDSHFKKAVAHANEKIMTHQRQEGMDVCPKISIHEGVQYPLT